MFKQAWEQGTNEPSWAIIVIKAVCLIKVDFPPIFGPVINKTGWSPLICNEIGRGTATFDGMAIAQSMIEYIAIHIRCITLFSTH